MSALLRPGRIALVLSLAFACAAPLSEKWKAVPVATSEGALVDTSLVKRIELPNGLRLLILEDHRLPRVVLGLTVRRGAGVESPAQAGLAKFVAAGMDRGAGTRNAIDLARTVDGMGASLMVSAGWDLMQVGMKGLSSDTDSLLQILADVALRPRFEPAELRKARDMQLALLASAVDSPLTRVGWEMARVLYPSHRYGLPLSGTDQSVEAFDAAAARAFHREVFVPGNAIVSVSGDVRAAEIEARIRTLFGGWEKRKLPDEASPPPRPTPARTTLVVVDRPDLAQASIRVGQGGIARRSPDRIPAILVNAVLGGSGFSSRLMARVRAEEGLVYGVDSWFSMRRRAGPFQVSTATRVEEAGRVVDLLLEGIEGIRQNPPSDGELARVKKLHRRSFCAQSRDFRRPCIQPGHPRCVRASGRFARDLPESCRGRSPYPSGQGGGRSIAPRPHGHCRSRSGEDARSPTRSAWNREGRAQRNGCPPERRRRSLLAVDVEYFAAADVARGEDGLGELLDRDAVGNDLGEPFILDVLEFGRDETRSPLVDKE